MDKNPYQAKSMAAECQAKTDKKASYDTFKRVLRKAATSGNAVDTR